MRAPVAYSSSSRARSRRWIGSVTITASSRLVTWASVSGFGIPDGTRTPSRSAAGSSAARLPAPGSGAACGSRPAAGRSTTWPLRSPAVRRRTAPAPVSDTLDRVAVGGQPGDVRVEVTSVGAERVLRASLLGDEPREELLDLERQLDGGTTSRRVAQPSTASRRSVSNSATTVLASAISPSTTCDRVGQREVQQLHVVLLRTLPVEVDRRAVGGQEDRRDRIGHPRRRIDLGEQFEVTRRETGLLDQLAARHLVGRLTLDVAHSGRDLDDRPLVRRAVLRDEHDRWVALGVEHERHHADRAGRSHDVTGERCPSGSTKSATATLHT